MNATDARKSLEALSIEPSDKNFFKYLQAGDREVVELFLDSGVRPDLCDADRDAAVVVAVNAGQKDIARLLLARGASAEPLLNRPTTKKDTWEKITASSSILNFISSLLIALVGGYFTYSYNQRQIDLNRTQADHESIAKDQANKVLELEAVQKLIPTLTSRNDEQGKAAALIAIQDLAHPELAAHMAVLFGGEGSVQYLLQAASSGNANAKQAAVQALSTIANSGTTTDSRLASRALSSISCDDLKAYVDAAGNHFRSLRGAADPDGGGEAFNAKRSIGNFDDCQVWIYRDRTMGDSAVCQAIGALDEFRASIQACVGPGWSSSSRQGDYKFEGPGGVDIRLHPKPKNIVELWVDSSH